MANKAKSIFQIARKFKAIKYKGCVCKQCNMNLLENYWNADFHHDDPTKKEFSITLLISIKDWNILANELDKCSLLCVCCHRKIHGLRNDIDIKDALNLLENTDIETLYNRKSTRSDKNTAKKLFQLGHSYEEIAEIIKFKESTIRGWCPKNIPTIDWNDEENIKKLKIHYELGIPLGEICSIFKCTYRTIKKKIITLIKQNKIIERSTKHSNQFTANPKRISIDGIIYINVYEASKKLDINYTTIKSRLLSKNFDNYFYL